MTPDNCLIATEKASQPTKLEKLKALAELATKLGEGELEERVAVPNPTGGYTMVLRKLKSS